jgi:hypothetical protein
MNVGFTVSYVGLWILVAFQGLLVVAVLTQLAELRRLAAKGALPEEDRLRLGSPAPAFSGLDLRSRRTITGERFDGRGGVLLFVSPDCSTCHGLADAVRQADPSWLELLVVVCQGGEAACTRFLERFGPGVRVLIEAGQTADLYRVSSVPTAVAVDGRGMVRAEGHPSSLEDLAAMVTRGQGVESLPPAEPLMQEALR